VIPPGNRLFVSKTHDILLCNETKEAALFIAACKLPLSDTTIRTNDYSELNNLRIYALRKNTVPESAMVCMSVGRSNTILHVYVATIVISRIRYQV